jgi:hypothetical protein
MEEMVPVMLGRLRGKEVCVTCFIWSAQKCEEEQCGDGATVEGGKSLKKSV